MRSEKIFYTTKVDLGDVVLVAEVYEGEACAVFKLFGPRGGLRSIITVPANVLADCVYAINDESNNDQSHLTPHEG